MSRQKALARLNEDLETLAAFDRLHDLATTHDSAETSAYASRQIRRLQIATEIENLKASRGSNRTSHVRIISGFVLLCSIGYISLLYLLR